MERWSTLPGQLVTRTEIADLYGGSIYPGIQTSTKTPNVMIYTDRAAGERNGYIYDGWSPDPGEDGVFYYTGAGQVGNHTMAGGNAALAQHVDDGTSIRLFATLPTARLGGKLQQYLGEFVVDPLNPYRVEVAPDRSDAYRSVFVFRLLAKGPERLRDIAPTAISSSTRRGSSRFPEVSTTDRSQILNAFARGVRFVDPEKQNVEQFERLPMAGQVASRNEASLVRGWEAHLRLKGHVVERARIPVVGERELITDTIDRTAQVLYEAKSSSDRSTVRLAIGQLHDYGRFLPDLQKCVLLPEPPSTDVGNLIESCGFGLVFQEHGSWRMANLAV